MSRQTPDDLLNVVTTHQSPMYTNESDRSSSDSEIDHETVRPSPQKSLNAFADNFVDRFHPDLQLENQESDDENSESIENAMKQGVNLEDIFFQDSPGSHPCFNRLDTVEEVTEPGSSDFLPDDDARIGSSGQPSSDFQEDSLPPDQAKSSITSREEVFSILEIHIPPTTWPPNESQLGKKSNSPFQDSFDMFDIFNLNQTDTPAVQLKALRNEETPGFSKQSSLSRTESLKEDESTTSSAILTEPTQLKLDKEIPDRQGETDSDNEDLSVSLPSEGEKGETFTKERLFEVQDEIRKLCLLTDEEASEATNSSNRNSSSQSETSKSRARVYVVNGSEEGDGDDADGDNDDESSIDDEILKFSEKHEFEDVEKLLMSKRVDRYRKMSAGVWSSEDVVDDACITIDNDSGIDRDVTSRVSAVSVLTSGLSESRGSNYKIWSKLQKVKRRFGGSTGSLSSGSPISEQEKAMVGGEEFYSSNIANMESPKEGGFDETGPGRSVIMMQTHIKELMMNLAKAESDKQKIAEEAYRRVQSIQREYDSKLESAAKAQTHQASLVERLQLKLLKYRDQCQVMENRLFEVNHLANQSQIRVKDTNEVLRSLEERLRLTEDQHAVELKSYQVRLEEAQEKSKTYDEVNSVLRSQLNQAVDNNESLSKNLKRVADDWEKLNKELIQKEEQWRCMSQAKVNLDHQKLLNLWQDVLSFRRMFADLKMNTQKDLMALKGELNNTGRNVTTACLNVYTNSNYLNVGDGGKPIHVGSQKELWMQLQRLKVEKQLSEQQKNESMNKCRQLSKELEGLKNEIKRVVTERDDLARQISNSKEKAENETEPGEKTRELEVQNSQLQTSLLNIAKVVIEDAEKEKVDETDLNLSNMSVFTPSVSRNFRTLTSPTRGRSSSVPRRTRSASPAILESTITAVQAALNKRQLQIHELRTKITTYSDKVEDLTKTLKSKEEILDAVESKLNKERLELDNTKVSLDEARRDKSKVQEQLEMLHVEKASVERSRHNVQLELDNISKEKTQLKEANSKLSREFQILQAEHEHSLKFNEKLSKDNKEKLNLISQLEKVGSSLREELMITKTELQKSSQALEVATKEKLSKEASTNSLLLQTNSSVEEIQRMKREEKIFKETISKLEASQGAYAKNIQILEDQLSKVEEERTKLRLELADHDSNILNLKDEVHNVKLSNEQLLKERTSLQTSLKGELKRIEKIEADLKRANFKRDEVENQLTAVTLEKDVLQDEIGHVRKEMDNFRDHLTRVCDENVKLTKLRSELEYRVEQTEKELLQLEEKMKFLRSEKSGQAAMIDEIQLELDESMGQRKKLEEENQEMKSKIKALREQMKTIQTEFDDDIARITKEKSELETEKEELKERTAKTISKLKSDLEENEDRSAKELEDVKAAAEKRQKEEATKLTNDFQEKISSLETELADLHAEFESFKHSNNEEAFLAENEKQQGLLLAQQELIAMKEKMEDVTKHLEDARIALDKLKREGQSRSEKDRNTICELQLEISRLKSFLDEKETKYENAQFNLNEQLQREKEAKFDLESQLEAARNELSLMMGRSDALFDELSETKRKLNQTSEAKQYMKEEIKEAEMRLLESRNQIEILDRLKMELQSSVRNYELDKMEDQKLIQQYESQLTNLEKGSLEDRRDMKELNEKSIYLEKRNQELLEEINSLHRQVRSLETGSNDLEFQLKNFREKSFDDEDQRELLRRENQELRIRFGEVESAKDCLEREIASLKLSHEGEEESVKLKLQSMSQALDDLRQREKKLEDQRHNLEMALSDTHQEINSLNLSLTSSEGRMSEMQSTIARLETSKKDVEMNLINICNTIQQFRSPTGISSRPATPTRSSRMGTRRTSSPWTPMSTVGEIDVEAIKANIRDLVSRMNLALNERDESLHQISSLKRQNDELLVNTVQLESQLNKSKLKIAGTEEQLRKLEHKISISDVNIANQEVELQKREREYKQLSTRLEATTRQLEDLQNIGSNSDDEVRQIRSEKNKLEGEKRRLMETINEYEAQNSRLEVSRKGLEGDYQRLQATLSDKESEIKNLRSKCDSFMRGITNLEDKCSNLSSNVDHLNIQLERSLQNESDLQTKVTELSRSLNITSSSSHEIQDQILQLQRSLNMAESEKNIIEDRLSSFKSQNTEMKRNQETLQEKISQLQADLQKSESRANQTELALQTSRAQLENGAPDNYLREELGRLRRENDDMQQRLRELTKKITMVESDKEDLEKRLQQKHKQSRVSDQVDHVRTQIPLMAGRSPSHFQHSDRASPVFHHHHHCGEHMIKIRLLEQENERQLRKIRALEQQLAELEKLHGARVQELLQERRQERDKENRRHKESVRQMETSLNAKEQIFKDRIHGLEEQVDVLKSQLSKEMRRRQNLIVGTSGISHEISELRQNLDQSLYNVSTTADSRLDGKILDREAGRLNMTADKFGADVASRLTPSRLHSTPNEGQRYGLTPTNSFLKPKRTLTFDMDT